MGLFYFVKSSFPINFYMIVPKL